MKKVIFILFLFIGTFLIVGLNVNAAIPSGVSFEATYYSYGTPYSFTTEDIFDVSNGKIALIVETEQWTDDWLMDEPNEYITYVNIGSDSSIYFTLILEIDYGSNYYNQMYFDLRGNNDVEIAYTLDGNFYDLEIDYGNGVQSATFSLANVPNHRFYLLNSNYVSDEVRQQYYDDGYDDGYIIGEAKGNADGYAIGSVYGDTQGYNRGYGIGYAAGNTSGYTTGYNAAELFYHTNGFGLDDDTSFSYAAGFASANYQPNAETAILTAIASVLGLGGSWLIYLNNNFSLFGITLFIVIGLTVAVGAILWLLKR